MHREWMWRLVRAEWFRLLVFFLVVFVVGLGLGRGCRLWSDWWAGGGR